MAQPCVAADAGGPPQPFSFAFGPARLHCSFGVMIKAVASWVLIVVGGASTIGASVAIAVQLVHAVTARSSRPGFLPALRVPDFMGMSIDAFGFKTKPFLTDTWAFLTGQLAVALLVLAIGLHLHHLHRQALGEQRLKELGIPAPVEPGASPNGGPAKPSADSHLAGGPPSVS